jgi:hypothetical protein
MSDSIRRLNHLAGIAVVTFGAIAVYLVLVSYLPLFSSMTVMVVLTGMAGAVVKNTRRVLLLSQSRQKTVLTESDERILTIQLYLSTLVGGLLALVLWAAFLGGLVQGALFPKITVAAQPYTDLSEFMTYTHLESFADAAKALFWSFIAGYSERFMPSIIDKLLADDSKK